MDKEKIKNKIIQEIHSLDDTVQELQIQTQPITPDCSLGSLTREEMMIEQEVYKQTLHEASIRRNKLKFALTKLSEDEYGICIECEEPIAFERLLLLPESSYCVACKSELGL